MDYITSTELRTKTPELIKALKAGKTVPIFHRSKKIGLFVGQTVQQKSQKPKPFDPKAFLEDAKDLDLGPISNEEMDYLYRQAMEKKHGKRVS